MADTRFGWSCIRGPAPVAESFGEEDRVRLGSISSRVSRDVLLVLIPAYIRIPRRATLLRARGGTVEGGCAASPYWLPNRLVYGYVHLNRCCGGDVKNEVQRGIGYSRQGMSSMCADKQTFGANEQVCVS